MIDTDTSPPNCRTEASGRRPLSGRREREPHRGPALGGINVHGIGQRTHQRKAVHPISAGTFWTPAPGVLHLDPQDPPFGVGAKLRDGLRAERQERGHGTHPRRDTSYRERQHQRLLDEQRAHGRAGKHGRDRGALRRPARAPSAR